MKITGSKAWVFFDSFNADRVISYTGGAPVSTEAEKWYRVMEKGEGSDLPFGVGFPFKSPKEGAEQIALVAGDSIYPLDPTRFCKTSASLSAEQGTVDVGDDCDPGATILDGVINVTGSLAGFFRYNDETGDFDSVTDDVVNRFFDVAEDDGAGIYALTKRTDDPTYILCCLNSNAAVGQLEPWLFVPVNISSMSMNLGNTDVQNKDLSWTKGEGPAVIYKRVKTAA
ncbi:MAG: hypothetical protein LBU85_08905 [Treponema sp.]|jgi:hypothetical protein|nr:hypothetical protein [Treponema sp.]